jgi:hypothetical protein
MRASPAFLSAEDVLEQAWDENADPFTNVVFVTISRLRRKLGDPGSPHLPRRRLPHHRETHIDASDSRHSAQRPGMHSRRLAGSHAAVWPRGICGILMLSC